MKSKLFIAAVMLTVSATGNFSYAGKRTIVNCVSENAKIRGIKSFDEEKSDIQPREFVEIVLGDKARVMPKPVYSRDSDLWINPVALDFQELTVRYEPTHAPVKTFFFFHLGAAYRAPTPVFCTIEVMNWVDC